MTLSATRTQPAVRGFEHVVVPGGEDDVVGDGHAVNGEEALFSAVAGWCFFLVGSGHEGVDFGGVVGPVGACGADERRRDTGGLGDVQHVVALRLALATTGRAGASQYGIGCAL